MSETVEAVRAPPPGHRRFPLLDGVRAIAALAIIGVHLADGSGFVQRAVIGDFAARLNVGVAIFFVLSGFLLYRPFLAARILGRPAPAPGRYLRRRLLRIVPAFWFALTAMWLLGWIRFPEGALKHYLFAQNTSGIGLVGGYGIPAAWTLDVEMAFYIVLPLIVALLARGPGSTTLRREIVVIASLGAASVLARLLILLENPGSIWAVQLPTMFAWFAGGMALAVGSVAIERRGDRVPATLEGVSRRPALLWAGAAAAYALCVLALDVPLGFDGAPTAWTNVAQHVLFLVVAVLVTAPAVLIEHAPADGAVQAPRASVSWLLGNPLAAWLGLISYGIFLWHQPFINQLIFEHQILDRAPVLPMVVLTALTLAGSILLGAFSYYVIERPFLRLKER